MKLDEVIVTDTTDRLILPENFTEDMLTEGFIDDKIRPQLERIFSKKVKNKSKYENKYQRKLNDAKSTLEANGIDANEVEQQSKDIIKSKGEKKVTPSIIKNQLQEIMDELKSKGISQFTFPIVMALIVLVINTTFITIASLFMPPSTAFIMMAVLLAPVTEEISKYISIKREETGAYLIVFNIIEFSSYTLQASAFGGAAMAINGIIRLLPVIMHTFWTAIMRHSYKAGSDKPYISTGLMHGLYNLFPLVGAPVTIIAGLRKDTTVQRQEVGNEI